jgi:hypothetical protein
MLAVAAVDVRMAQVEQVDLVAEQMVELQDQTQEILLIPTLVVVAVVVELTQIKLPLKQKAAREL